ncbi:MAG: cytidylate kinase-like family protein [Anaerolineae bacterium]|nr:cytidylate kinase-like family protein [Anaerolineae bacterium]
MTVITISRQYGSGGDEIAERVASILGFRLFSKLLIQRAAQESGLAGEEAVDYSEDTYRVKNFIERITHWPVPIATISVPKMMPDGEVGSESHILHDDLAINLVEKAVRAAYAAGGMVIVGRGGQVILRDQPDVLHVRIEAPMEDRVQRIKEQIKRERGEFQADIILRRKAQDLIVTRDYTSADYLRQYYSINWDDPSLYHMILNTGKLNVDQAAAVVVELFHQMEGVRPVVA